MKSCETFIHLTVGSSVALTSSVAPGTFQRPKLASDTRRWTVQEAHAQAEQQLGVPWKYLARTGALRSTTGRGEGAEEGPAAS